MTRAWPDVFAATWLARTPAVEAFDTEVTRRLKKHGSGGTQLAELCPAGFQVSAEFLRVQGSSPDASFRCVLAAALLGELLMCADAGGILNDDKQFAGSSVAPAAKALRLLRNTVCHPAAYKKSDKATHFVALHDHVKKHYPTS